MKGDCQMYIRKKMCATSYCWEVAPGIKKNEINFEKVYAIDENYSWIGKFTIRCLEDCPWWINKTSCRHNFHQHISKRLEYWNVNNLQGIELVPSCPGKSMFILIPIEYWNLLDSIFNENLTFSLEPLGSSRICEYLIRNREAILREGQANILVANGWICHKEIDEASSMVFRYFVSYACGYIYFKYNHRSKYRHLMEHNIIKVLKALSFGLLEFSHFHIEKFHDANTDDLKRDMAILLELACKIDPTYLIKP